MDGVYAEQPDGRMLFHPLPAPGDEDIARLAHAVCRKVMRYLGQLTGEDKDQQLTLDHLANASVQGLVASGPLSDNYISPSATITSLGYRGTVRRR